MRTAFVFLVAAVVVLGAGALGANGVAPPPDESSKRDETENPVVFWELASHDAGASVDFFKKVFDWRIEMLPNTIIHGVGSRNGDHGIEGKIFTLRKAKLPFLTIYILVDDIEEKARLIEEAGGYLVEPPHEISAGLWICLFNDPSGVTFAMLQRTNSGEQ